jgi:GNAT superfamily N-acetyltransferase
MGEVTDITSALGGKLSPPSAINAVHDLSQFHSGNDALDDWLRFRALKNEGRSSRTYVVAQGRQVVGYYCLSTGAEKRESVPSKIARNTPDPVPLIILGRLAVDTNHQGKGIGAGLLKDALCRSLQVSHTVGARAVLVHAIDRNAMAFYLKYGFLEFPCGTQSMFLPMETIKVGVS